MPFLRDTLGLTIVLALLTSIGPLSTDMYLPSLPTIMEVFQVNEGGVQLTLSAFLFGFAGGQIFYGPIADRYGRKPILLASLVIFTLASVLCALSQNILTLIVARIIQAFGAAGSIVLARAVVRDLYEGTRAGQELALMGTIMGFVPAIAPAIGAVIAVLFGWNAVFWSIALSGIGLILLVLFSLPETLDPENVQPLSFVSAFRSFGSILATPDFRYFATLVCLTYGGLFTFISASSFVFQIVYDYSRLVFGFAFGICALSFVVGTIIGRRFVVRAGAGRTIFVGTICLAVSGVSMTGGIALGPHHGLMVLIPMVVYMIGVGMILPHSAAGAMQPFRERAGAASSLMGLIQMVSAATLGVLVGQWLSLGEKPTPWPLALVLAAAGLLAVILALRRSEALRPKPTT